MAVLNDTQRSQLRMYTGWSERFHQSDVALEQAMNAFDMYSSLQQAAVLAELASCVAMDAELAAAHKRFKAVKVGSIGLDPKGELGILRSEGRRHSGRIAALLGVEVRHDCWSGSGPSARMAMGGLTFDTGYGGGEVKLG